MYFICNLQTLVERDQRDAEIQAAHLQWLKDTHANGGLALSGRRPGYADGHYIIRADSREEAEAIAWSDPNNKARNTSFELVEWAIGRGSIVIEDARQG